MESIAYGGAPRVVSGGCGTLNPAIVQQRFGTPLQLFLAVLGPLLGPFFFTVLWGTEAHVPVLEKRRGGAVTAVRQRQTAGYCQEETSEVLLIF